MHRGYESTRTIAVLSDQLFFFHLVAADHFHLVRSRRGQRRGRLRRHLVGFGLGSVATGVSPRYRALVRVAPMPSFLVSSGLRKASWILPSWEASANFLRVVGRNQQGNHGSVLFSAGNTFEQAAADGDDGDVLQHGGSLAVVAIALARGQDVDAGTGLHKTGHRDDVIDANGNGAHSRRNHGG